MKSERGSIHILILAAVLLLIGGGLFFLSTVKKPSEVQPTTLIPITSPAESLSPTPLPTLSSSDDVNAIDLDIQSTQVTDDSQDLKSIESDLNSF